MPESTTPPHSSSWINDNDYAPFRVYGYYRALLSSLLLLMYSAGGIAIKILGTHNPKLFVYTAVSYCLMCIVSLIRLWRTRTAPGQEHLFLLLFIDCVAITLMMHASGSTESGLGFLLLICVATGSIFLSSQIALLLAAIASLLVIAESSYVAFQVGASSKHLFAAGILGFLLFGTALIFRHLTKRLQASHKETAYQAQQAAHLERLAEQIVERMNTGMVVVNGQNQILLMNRAAKRLLGLNATPFHLGSLPEVEDQLQIWRAYPHSRTPYITLPESSTEVRINFANLDRERDSDTLIFIEDNRQISQQAQQLKLASLGRLTASIAHEVRNPLGAISHASQLLQESPSLDKADTRLTEIIQTHSIRVNQIIENVLRLSRRQATQVETLDLGQWLPEFVQEYRQGKDPQPLIDIHIKNETVTTKADPSQLRQVISNLCDNGLRYSLAHTGDSTLSLYAGTDADTELPYIEVVDQGPGLQDEQLNQAFEPFYTSDPSGSGLGLYICKELCEANEATLQFKRTQDQESCFKITLAHPNRVFS